MTEEAIKVDMRSLVGDAMRDIAVKNTNTGGLFWYRGQIKYINDHYLFLKKENDGRLIVLNHSRILEIR
jgi:hypothetical protein